MTAVIPAGAIHEPSPQQTPVGICARKPTTSGRFTESKAKAFRLQCLRDYPVVDGIPFMFVPNAWPEAITGMVSSRSMSVANCGTDLCQLPQFTPWHRGQRRFGLRLLANCVRGVPA
jgi:hypothetical protein